ncbi:MAG: 23S rRNA (uracil(1939)-C(5))-methyltransferase RlmD [Gammaproteobacteria bacterium]|jgi:23S rRNA (uracil1939-C5)-methyltransferase
MAARKSRLPAEPVEARIESLAQDGRGVTHLEGKAVFIHGALPAETVRFKYTGRHRQYDEGVVEEVIEPSPDRIVPHCEHFGVCGGCSLQHMAPEAQIAAKQQVLTDALWHIGKVEAGMIDPPLTGPVWGYRRKARLGVKYVPKKGRVLVGFRERQSRYLADLHRCEVLHPAVGERLEQLGALIGELDARERIPQIEVAAGDEAVTLVFRHLDPLGEADRARLADFARETGLQVALQSAGPDSIVPLWPESQRLYYRHPEHDVTIDFGPSDFIQVNAAINHNMVNRALMLLELNATDQVLELFSGLGNFTLPLARHCAHVTAVEVDTVMVKRGDQSALNNDIHNVAHVAADLGGELKGAPWLKCKYDKILLDPPRSGAQEVIAHFGKLGATRIVYVSCNPATLARDAAMLVNEFGYTLERAGVMDMFPHTAHVESIALFVK